MGRKESYQTNKITKVLDCLESKFKVKKSSYAVFKISVNIYKGEHQSTDPILV